MQQEAEGSRPRRRKPDMALYVPKARREREAQVAGAALARHRQEPENLAQDTCRGSSESQRRSPHARTQASRAVKKENKVDAGPKEPRAASAGHCQRLGGSCPAMPKGLEVSPCVREPSPDPAAAQPWDGQDKTSHDRVRELSHCCQMLRTEPDRPSPPSEQPGTTEAVPEPGGDPASPTPPPSLTPACWTEPSNVSEHTGDSSPDPARDLSQCPEDGVLQLAGLGNQDSVPRLVWEVAGPKAHEEERECVGSSLAGQGKSCAAGVPEEEERWEGTAELTGETTLEAPRGASFEPACSRGGMDNVAVLRGESAPGQGMVSPSQLLPGKENTAGAGHLGGESDPVRAAEGAGSTSACTDGIVGAESSLLGAGKELLSGMWEGTPPESCEPPPSPELLCCGVEGLSLTAWAEEPMGAAEDMGSPQQEAEEEEGGLHSDCPKAEQANAENPSQASPGAEESWDALFNDDGDCLDPRLLEEVSPASWCAWGFAGMVAAACGCKDRGLVGSAVPASSGVQTAPGALGQPSVLQCLGPPPSPPGLVPIPFRSTGEGWERASLYST